VLDELNRHSNQLHQHQLMSISSATEVGANSIAITLKAGLSSNCFNTQSKINSTFRNATRPCILQLNEDGEVYSAIVVAKEGGEGCQVEFFNPSD